MPRFHFPWHDSIPDPDPEPTSTPPTAPDETGAVARWPEPPGPMSTFGQPAPPAQPLEPADPWTDPGPLPPLDILPQAHDPLPDDPPWRGDPARCYVCGRRLRLSEETLCWHCELVTDVAFAVYVGELSEWPGQCVNDRVMLATHPESLGLRKVPWQATVTAILSAAGVWLEDMPPGD